MNKFKACCAFFAVIILSWASLAQVGESFEVSVLPVESVSPPPDRGDIQSAFEFSYLGFLERSGRVGNSHFKDAAGADQYSAYATDLDTESHFKLSYQFQNKDRITINQRVYFSQVVDQSNWKEGGEVPSFAQTRLEYSHNLDVGQDSSVVMRATLPSTYDYYYNQNFLAGLAGIANLNWQTTPRIKLGTTHYVGTMLYGGNPRALSPWQVDALAHGYSNDITPAQAATYLNNTGAQRDSLLFDNRINFTYNFSDKLSFVQTVGYGAGLKDISNNFSNFSRVTAQWEIFPELDYQVNKAVGLALGAFQVAGDIPGAEDLVSGKSYYFDGYNFVLLRPEQTTYYVLVSYVY